MSALISNPAIRSLLRGVLVWAPLWISTTFVFGVMGLGYVLLLKEDTYLASQALLVRDEATGAVMRLGRFQSQAEMKAAQETILEMAKSQQVVRDALLAIGKPSGWSSWLSWGEYPSKEQIESVAKSDISVHAPKGTEFGVTEVIYLDVRANNQGKAQDLSKALCDSLESRMQQVRTARADGVVMELTNARDSAKRELVSSTTRLRQIETSAGSDLTDLRGMTDPVAGASTLRTLFDQIRNEIRQAEVAKQSLLSDKEMLLKAADEPSSFIVAPGNLLNSQPGLKRLREGLVDAQIVGSQLSGKFTDSHPLVNASQTAQSTIAKRLVQELKASISGVDSEIELVDAKIRHLMAEQTGAEERLSTLADSRSTYANLLSEVKSKVAILEAAERELAEAQAARDSSVSTSLLTRLDAPLVSDRPIGPGRTTITGMCTIAGLIFGLGIVFIVTPIDIGPAFGRRSADRFRSRRGQDDDSITAPDKLQPTTPNDPAQSISTNATTTTPTSGLQHTLLNLQSSTVSSSLQSSRPSEDTSPELLDAYQPLIQPRPAKVVAELKSDLNAVSNTAAPSTTTGSDSDPDSNRKVDLAFQELSRLRTHKPESRSEELSLQMKVQELKLFLSSQGIQPMDIDLKFNSQQHPRLKPRPSRSN
ncbi:MAG: hypothetical protein ABL921_14470 [Pirellula sp.]